MLARLPLACAVFSLCVVIAGSQVALSDEFAPSVDRFEPRSGDVILFLGDRVTERAEFTQFFESFLLTRFAGRDFRVVNGGLAGDWTAGSASRQFHDISANRPTVVIVFPSLIEAGNAPFPDDLFRSFRQELFELERGIRELSAEPIYVSPLSFDVRGARRGPAIPPLERGHDRNARLAYYGAWLRDFATESSARFVDLQGSLHRWTQALRTNDAEFTFFPDGHQPSPTGHLAIACTILEELGLAKTLATIHISRQGDQVAVFAENGQVLSAVSDSPDSLSFLWIADALPWAVPSDLQSPAGLLHLAERFNQETLRVSGLRDGRYQLLIDDMSIGNFTAVEFADGIPLQQFVTPQSEQSRKISQANDDRTKSFVRPAREVAELIVAQERLINELVTPPDDVSATDRRKTVQARLAQLQAEKDQLDAAANDAWNALQDSSQPIPRRFVIRPIPKVQVQGRVFVAGMPISGAAVELHGIRGLTAGGTTDAMGFFKLTPKTPDEISPGEGWLVILSQMVLPKFVSLESSGHRVLLRAGVNEIELHFEEMLPGE